MKLIDKRRIFTRDLSALIAFGDSLGFFLILDQCKRTAREAKWNATHCRVMNGGDRCERTPDEHAGLRHSFKPIGIEKSTHRSGLAADLYIIVDGAISNDRAKYALLGDFWKEQRAGNCWGGDFSGFPDLGHFSREHRGRK